MGRKKLLIEENTRVLTILEDEVPVIRVWPQTCTCLNRICMTKTGGSKASTFFLFFLHYLEKW